MNISSEISSTYEFNSSDDYFSNDTEAGPNFEMLPVGYIICSLLNFPINSYVIWLIVTGTGNGLAAEFFILNFSVCEIIQCVKSVMMYFMCESEFFRILVVFLEGLISAGCPLFECLISVERYLAVVHPVTFLKYKPLRYRLMCAAVSWAAVFAVGGFNAATSFVFYDIYLHFLIALFLVVFSVQLFCCVAVLRALKQSGPGERGRERGREEENHMKRRAFHLILITTVTTVMVYTPYTVFLSFPTAAKDDFYLCLGQFCFILAGLVQPILYLYRVGKLNFIKCQ